VKTEFLDQQNENKNSKNFSGDKEGAY